MPFGMPSWNGFQPNAAVPNQTFDIVRPQMQSLASPYNPIAAAKNAIGPDPNSTVTRPAATLEQQAAAAAKLAETTNTGLPNPQNATGTDPYSGFASAFAPDVLRNAIYDNPWMVLPKVFPGMQQGSPGYQNLRDIGADPLTLFNITQGSFNPMTNYNEGDYANWLNTMYKGLGTVGGRSFNSRELMNSVLNSRDNSAIRNALKAGDTSTQVRTLYNLMSESANAGMNPLAARAMQSRLAQEGDRYLTSSATSDAGSGAQAQTFDQWLKQNAPGMI